MPTRDVDPYSSEQVWRRMLALVEKTGRTERSFAAWCEINYNQFNNYKNQRRMPSRSMFESVMRRTGVDYGFLRYGDQSRLSREDDDKLTEILKRAQ